MELYDEKIEEEIAQSKLPVLVEFFAEWCGPCKIMEPVIKEISQELTDKAKIFTINIEENQKLTDKFTILNLPTFIVYKNGGKVKHLVGIQEKETLLEILQPVLDSNRNQR